MKSRFQMLLVGALLGVVAITGVKTAYALSISPLNFEVNGNPGEKISNIVRIYNDTESVMSVEMTVQDFVAAGEKGEVLVKEAGEETGYGLAKWVGLTPASFSLAPRSSQMVEFTIDVPISAEPGGHYASILASTGGTPGEGSSGVGVVQKIGSLLLLNVAGEVREDMSVLEFTVPEFSEYGPETITARFSNEGTVHLKPRGFVLVKNMLGGEIARVDLPQLNVLPNSVRKVDIPLEQGGQFGRYEATLAAIYGATNEPVSAVTVYWVIPWKALAVIGAIILVLLVLIIKARKRLGIAFRIIFKGNSSGS
ncbi:MAG: hypothetical protein A3H06_01330 [Candidatus Colwellbacteria bacterium RIFCSPLOWO2_12_FULL_44_13]|uniref:DUF916 domain-containing protein n=3 Tax=Candidatus Colwelliibacteriota TaxID=1817904 RepID=A0A1G1Z9C2_9BACT|nr:MAG: hypothetical protein A3F24_00555 [Candidatus Colwellbacteria bacterium RIFCSPHIGHO2_12_FULL_44_17]OGY60470.1 MAG: hypothetical protein A3I31_01700 [Candidatus Colwellbacteria bacterium RIFCSPLOWO2_02_FULL_44_20b]OGY62001.1 MAG: hypothetical protein A3H06_01330 [Candidatus Colwellbacteria bacterium RIFCSPLOWO2_12_FULL_44_13]